MLIIKDLYVKLASNSEKSEDKTILNGVDLTVNKGEIHALMGHNGSGKSTLAQTIMGHSAYELIDGSILFEGKSLLELEPQERARAGVFLSFQYPSEVPGVTVSSFLRMIYNKAHSTNLTPVKFRTILAEKMQLLDMKEEFTNRYLNEGFSGGEKKRMEMLQLLLLEPKLAILDEIDSGLDIDALKIVANAVNIAHEQFGTAILIITHYARILKFIEPDFVHVMHNGKIVKSGDKALAHEIEDKGYSTFN